MVAYKRENMLHQINCPRCSSPITVDVYQVVDAQRTPELKYALLNGQLNAFVCPNCGLAGQMASPLLYHDSEHELFMVYVPMELNMSRVEQERLIGQMVKQVMDSLPPEARRGYMLQPQTIINYQTFLEKVLETEGVTAEMIARQREQAQFLETLVQSDKALRDQYIQDRPELIDETFFAIMQSAMQVAEQRRDNERLLRLTNLQAKLFTETEVGRRLEKQQTALRKLNQDVRRAEGLSPKLLLEHILANAEDEQVVEMLATAGSGALTYEFFALLTEQIEAAARQKDKPRVKLLSGVRKKLLDFQRAMQEAGEKVANRANEVLQEILHAPDVRQALLERLAEIDEAFMYVLAARIAEAEQTGNQGALAALREVYNLIIEEAERQVPPQIRFLNRLLRVETDEEQRQLLDENAELVNQELVMTLDRILEEMDEEAPAEMRERLSRLKGMISLRVLT